MIIWTEEMSPSVKLNAVTVRPEGLREPLRLLLRDSTVVRRRENSQTSYVGGG